MLKNLPKKEKLTVIILLFFCIGFLTTSILLYTERDKEIKLKLQFKEELNRTLGLKKLLENEVTELKTAKEEMKTELDETKRRADNLSNELEREKKMREAVVEQLNKAKAEAEKLKMQFATEKQDKLQIQERLSKINKDKDELAKQLEQLAKAKNDLEERIKKLMGEPKEGVELKKIVVKPDKQIEGEVLVVNKEFNFIVVNVGKNDGLKIGSELTIYKGEEPIAKVKVEKLYSNMAAAGIMEGSDKNQIKEGAIVKY